MVTSYKDVRGWNSRKTGIVEYYRCPTCRHCQEVLIGHDGVAECFGCHRDHRADSFGTARLRRAIATCGGCGENVSFTPSYDTGIGYMCPECKSYVAFHYGSGALDPRTILGAKWNLSVKQRGGPMDGDGRVIVRCRSAKDFLVLRVLGVMAQREDQRFLSVRKGEAEAELLFDRVRRKFLGFLAWNTVDGHAVLRQLYIVPEERRKGLAATFVKYWVENYADRLAEQFGIESPNEKSTALLVKLGYVNREADGNISSEKVLYFASL